ncbi:N-acetylmannosamine-6-phosphate 2-epimerase [Lentibacillus saliphilus]|uniref:N-acetylmannosamine-6-phosphate 2-epimerase n=1 Tax=Lentibacillus saliphilus TaxID=2737028 RepID=UPI001C3078D8|nr:N-acetylmannosamine-6-phosphate 2-epimerase [Lentibacillus saliphilus]
MKNTTFLQQIKGKLIVSCQALEGEPLYGSDVMAKMAIAAEIGGAKAIRANGVADIIAIKQVTDLPIIGLIKQNYPDSPVYITPTKKEVAALIDAGADVIAIDSTAQKRPNDEKLSDLFQYIKDRGRLILADISTAEEGLNAFELGADAISTTLSGYTDYTKSDIKGPDIALVKKLTELTDRPVIAEGRINTPEEARALVEYGAHAVVVGSAITRPRYITASFVEALGQ